MEMTVSTMEGMLSPRAGPPQGLDTEAGALFCWRRLAPPSRRNRAGIRAQFSVQCAANARLGDWKRWRRDRLEPSALRSNRRALRISLASRAFSRDFFMSRALGRACDWAPSE